MNQVDDSVGRDRTGAADGRVEDLSVFNLIGALIRHRWMIAVLASICALVLVIHAFTLDQTFRASATFVEQGGGNTGQAGLTTLARSFGIRIGDDNGRSPQFYLELLGMRRILEAAAASRYRVVRGGTEDTVELADVYGIEADSADRRVRAAAAQLRESITAAVTPDVGMINLSVTSPSPELSEQLVARLLALVDDVNTGLRREHAAASREFIDGQMDQAAAELEDAEGALERFLENNRSFESSPELMFEYDRLQRQVALKQSVYNSLAESYEQANIDAVRNTPQISIIERPEGSASPVRPSLLLRTVLGVLLGGFVGMLSAFAFELYRRAESRGRPDVEEMKREWSAAAHGFRALRSRVRVPGRRG